MRKILIILLVAFGLSGCNSNGDALDRAVSLRNRLLQNQVCTFDAVITADYGNEIYTFRTKCKFNEDRSLSFEVVEPNTIAGISGNISAGNGIIRFSDTILAFPMLADGQITPVTAPWVIMNTLCSGYIQYCGDDNFGIRIGIHDSYLEEALMLDIWTDEEDLPVRGEILWDSNRILSVDIIDFCFQ